MERHDHNVGSRDAGAHVSASSLPEADDRQERIRERLRLAPVRNVPEVQLYTAHPGSRLRQLVPSTRAPYWAYPWAGGQALARYALENPDVVAGKRVLDLGAGSGLVGIAAAKAGAGKVAAVDVDPWAVAATQLNTAANGVVLDVLCADLVGGTPPGVDLILAGDLFYDRRLAGRATRFFDRCVAAGIEVLVGDPGRRYLPRDRLRLIANYAIADFGASAEEAGQGFVFEFE